MYNWKRQSKAVVPCRPAAKTPSTAQTFEVKINYSPVYASTISKIIIIINKDDSPHTFESTTNKTSVNTIVLRQETIWGHSCCVLNINKTKYIRKRTMENTEQILSIQMQSLFSIILDM